MKWEMNNQIVTRYLRELLAFIREAFPTENILTINDVDKPINRMVARDINWVYNAIVQNPYTIVYIRRPTPKMKQLHKLKWEL